MDFIVVVEKCNYEAPYRAWIHAVQISRDALAIGAFMSVLFRRGPGLEKLW